MEHVGAAATFRYLSLTVLWFVSFASAQTDVPDEAAGDAHSRTQLVLLGTGTPNADPDRSGPAVAVVVDDTPYLIDCGPGIVRRAAAAHRNGVGGLAVRKLARVFVTHLHSDHTLGLPDLIFSPWVLGRQEALRVFGPPGIQAMAEHVQKAYAQDVHVRLDGLEPANTTGYKVEVTETSPGEIYKDDKVRVTAFAAPHGSWKHAFGYRFDTPDRSIVISGDTTPNPKLIEVARGCDILVHEVYSATALARRPPIWRRYHQSAHTSTHELAAIAREVRPKLLVLYHQLYWGATDEDLIREINERYRGRVVSGSDLDEF